MNVFVSYCRKDTNEAKVICDFLKSHLINPVMVSEDVNFDGINHQELSQRLMKKMDGCDVVIAVIGKETYQRPHVDLELHNALKGDIYSRRGLVAVFLENRGDGINHIDRKSYPRRLSDNENYVVRIQFSALRKKLIEAIEKADTIRQNPGISVNNSHPCMPLRAGKYFDQ